MKISTTNHPNKEYGCGLGKAKLNVYNGKLGFEYPLLSIGANNFQISTTIIYNSQYKNFELGSKKIGFGNGWKLNIQQYLIPYSSTYSLAGFNEGNYIYIDSNWNIHKFVKYKDESDYDFYVIVDDKEENLLELTQKAYRAMRGKKERPVDIVIVRLSKFEERKNWQLSLEREVYNKGVLLYAA